MRRARPALIGFPSSSTRSICWSRTVTPSSFPATPAGSMSPQRRVFGEVLPVQRGDREHEAVGGAAEERVVVLHQHLADRSTVGVVGGVELLLGDGAVEVEGIVRAEATPREVDHRLLGERRGVILAVCDGS